MLRERERDEYGIVAVLFVTSSLVTHIELVCVLFKARPHPTELSSEDLQFSTYRCILTNLCNLRATYRYCACTYSIRDGPAYIPVRQLS